MKSFVKMLLDFLYKEVDTKLCPWKLSYSNIVDRLSLILLFRFPIFLYVSLLSTSPHYVAHIGGLELLTLLLHCGINKSSGLAPKQHRGTLSQ